MADIVRKKCHHIDNETCKTPTPAVVANISNTCITLIAINVTTL